MVDDSVVVALVVGLVSAVVGVLLGYAFALRAARRQRRHEIKEGAYGRMFPKIQESIEILGGIQAVLGLELKKDETTEALVERLSQPLWVLGLTDAMTEMRGYLSDPAGTKQPPEL